MTTDIAVIISKIVTRATIASIIVCPLCEFFMLLNRRISCRIHRYGFFQIVSGENYLTGDTASC